MREKTDVNYKYSACEQGNGDIDQKSPPKKPLRRNLSKPNYENVILGPTGAQVWPMDEKTEPPKPELGSDIPFIDANLSQSERQKYDRSTSLLSDQLDIIEHEIDDSNQRNSEIYPIGEDLTKTSPIGEDVTKVSPIEEGITTAPRTKSSGSTSVSIRSESDAGIGV